MSKYLKIPHRRPTPERMKALRDVAAARRIVKKLENSNVVYRRKDETL